MKHKQSKKNHHFCVFFYIYGLNNDLGKNVLENFSEYSTRRKSNGGPLKCHIGN